MEVGIGGRSISYTLMKTRFNRHKATLTHPNDELTTFCQRGQRFHFGVPVLGLDKFISDHGTHEHMLEENLHHFSV